MSFTPVLVDHSNLLPNYLFHSRELRDFFSCVDKLEELGVPVSLTARRGYQTPYIMSSYPITVRFHLPNRVHRIGLNATTDLLADTLHTACVPGIPWQVAAEARAFLYDLTLQNVGSSIVMNAAWKKSGLSASSAPNARTTPGSYNIHYAAGAFFFTGQPKADVDPRPLFAEAEEGVDSIFPPEVKGSALGIYPIDSPKMSAHARLKRRQRLTDRLTYILPDIAEERCWGSPDPLVAV